MRVSAARGRRRSARSGLPAPAAGRLRRAGLSRLRLGESGDALGLLRPPLRRRRAAGARSRSASPAGGVLYPRAGTLGGCTAHNAMIFDLSARRRLGRHRRAHRRPLLERRTTCGAISSASRTAATGRSGAAQPAGHRPDRGMAGTAGSTPRRRSCRVDAHGRRRAAGWSCGRLGLRDATAARSLRALRGSDREARRIRTTGALVPGNAVEGFCYTPLSTAGHRRGRRARAGARRRPQRTRTAARRARRAGDARAVRRAATARSASNICRASASTARIRMPRDAGGERRQVQGAPRGHPRRRRVQHAAAPDAVRHRPARSAAAARDRGAGRSAGRRPESAGPLRGRRRQPDGSAAGTCSKAPRSNGTIRLTRVGRTRPGHLHLQRRGAAVDPAVAARHAAAGSFCLALVGRFDGYFPGYSERSPVTGNYLTWAILKAHTAQPRRRGDAALGRPARHAA